MKRIRIGNIEFRETAGESKLGEIVCWYTNPYFGKENEYNWSIDGEHGYKEYPNCTVHKSCFVNEESCYVISFVDNCGEDEEPDIRSVGSRFVTLSDEDLSDYIEVCKQMFKQYK